MQQTTGKVGWREGGSERGSGRSTLMAVSAAKGGRSAKKSQVFSGLREDSDLPTDLDKGFSHWKILVGPSDWENYRRGREGARRYRLHNLPSVDGFHAGVYELALYRDESIHSVSIRRGLRKEALVPVYVGHAVNVRDRLQAYGRSGSHLEGPLQNGACQHCKISFLTVVQSELGATKKIVPFDQEYCFSPHLFTRAFHFGYSIAYRWAEEKNKDDALDFETLLLQKYDYAWNAGNNGKRRAEDAFRKLKRVSRGWHGERTAKVSFNKCLPRLLLLDVLSKKREVIKENSTAIQLICCKEHAGHQLRTSVCEILDGSGNVSSCVWSPVRKESKSLTESRQHIESSALKTVQIGKHTGPSETGLYQVIDGRVSVDNPSLIVKTCLATQASENGMADQLNQGGSLALTCGYILEDGSSCMALPRKGRKRCAAHKGRRIKA